MKEKGKLAQIYQLDVYFPLFQGQERSSRYRNNVNFDNIKDMESIFKCIHNYITDDIKSTIYHTHILSNNTKKILKKIASEILLNGAFIRTDLIKFQYG